LDAYSNHTARYYKAYRPPLHERILHHCIENRHFNQGLDIGSGVGHSALALSAFCEQVTAFEPTLSMYTRAITNDSIDYVLSLSGQSKFDALLFFGSLNYITQQELTEHLQRATSNATLLCCDFVVDLDPLLNLFGIESLVSDYTPSLNLDSFDLDLAKSKIQETHRLSFSCSPVQAAYLLLADSFINKKLQENEDQKSLFQKVKTRLEAFSKSKPILLHATSYSTVYQ